MFPPHPRGIHVAGIPRAIKQEGNIDTQELEDQHFYMYVKLDDSISPFIGELDLPLIGHLCSVFILFSVTLVGLADNRAVFKSASYTVDICSCFVLDPAPVGTI